ncbi:MULTISPECIES: 3-oxoacyl-ACP reductase [Gordonia]|uniref:3-oxoacyl-ACP reductase n=1 Tax=Gordonia amicalis TaxID=89053 RepID=A0AAE4R8H6_9ACTN|nr:MULTISPECIES: 3-oxoacyl-ACP reductase [Gordonia]ATD72122.1 3-oxoacyl-ACP reductase [Gordonia sp. 1D]KAF0969294.1 putative short-chain type dehydrogenase/reductase [Gordonia sp. YY1]MBA5848190.1 3-oxoacyl-ACP reductase [Gordonia amicalis]MCR8895790.1 3-oxoacyl-ACP reductase [Gordonia sp. GONU]MCZ0914667.1 3-oxoacyl-ACP reductase [Gordonia amicalis]
MGYSLDGRVAVVTGAGAGLGRAEAIGLAAEGAAVVVNDLPAALDSSDVIDTITATGGRAIAVPGDISDSSTATAIMTAATEQLGSLDIVVNNAGVVRDKMLFNMTDDEWDLVIRVHLRGHFLLNRNAASHWRAASKAAGGPVYGRIINTSSEAGLLGPEGQANYGAAKAGITALTLSASRALKRYGVRANAICPRARTAMTADVFGEAPSDGVDPLDPAHVVRLVTYLAGPEADGVTGQVFVVYGPKVTLMAAPTIDEVFTADGDAWDSEDLAKTLTGYFADRDPGRTFSASALVN